MWYLSIGVPPAKEGACHVIEIFLSDAVAVRFRGIDDALGFGDRS